MDAVLVIVWVMTSLISSFCENLFCCTLMILYITVTIYLEKDMKRDKTKTHASPKRDLEGILGFCRLSCSCFGFSETHFLSLDLPLWDTFNYFLSSPHCFLLGSYLNKCLKSKKKRFPWEYLEPTYYWNRIYF